MFKNNAGVAGAGLMWSSSLSALSTFGLGCDRTQMDQLRHPFIAVAPACVVRTARSV
jgi:hypothetical protein